MSVKVCFHVCFTLLFLSFRHFFYTYIPLERVIEDEKKTNCNVFFLFRVDNGKRNWREIKMKHVSIYKITIESNTVTRCWLKKKRNRHKKWTAQSNAVSNLPPPLPHLWITMKCEWKKWCLWAVYTRYLFVFVQFSMVLIQTTNCLHLIAKWQ